MDDEARDSLQDEARGDLERLSAIIAIQNEIASSTQPYPLDAILTRAETLTRATGAAIELADGAEMLIHSGTGTAHALAGMRLPMDASLAGLATGSGMAVRSDDTSSDARADAAVVRRLGARSLIAVPIYHHDAFIGALEVFSTEPRAFRSRDMHTVQIMASLAGSALARTAALQHEASDRSAPVLELVQYEALHDPLTDLPREALLFDRLVHAIQLARREDTPLAVLVLEVDRLDELRHNAGVEAGNRTLRALASRVQDALRASDTVARTEGDEFAVLLPGANAIGALGTTKKIQRAVAQEYVLDGRSIALSVTAGVAIFPEHGVDATALLSRARDALEKARGSAAPVQIYSTE